MAGGRCNVTGSTNTKPLPNPIPPVWCQNNQKMCVIGPKQIVIWNQAERNNVVVEGFDAAGQPKSPGYNTKMGFNDGEFVKVFFFFLLVSQMGRNRCSN